MGKARGVSHPNFPRGRIESLDLYWQVLDFSLVHRVDLSTLQNPQVIVDKHRSCLAVVVHAWWVRLFPFQFACLGIDDI